MITKTKKMSIVMGLLCLSIYSNCAFIDRTVKPLHVKAANVKKLKAKIPISINEIKIINTGSAENLSYRQGIVKNGYGMETANVFTDPTPSELLKNLLKFELANAGFEVVDNVNEKNIKIDILIKQFFTEPEIGFFAISYYGVVECEIYLSIPNGKIYKKNIKSIGDQYSIGLGLFAEGGFEKAFDDFAVKLMPALIEILESEKGKLTYVY
jgi:hypothetical protein